MVSCMSIWSYSAYGKPAKIGFLLKIIGALTPTDATFCPPFTGGVASNPGGELLLWLTNNVVMPWPLARINFRESF